MGRHGLKYCLLCNPDGNGTSGEDGTEAIGKYYLPKDGWIPVCEGCARTVDKYYDVEPFQEKRIMNTFERKRMMKKDITNTTGKKQISSQKKSTTPSRILGNVRNVAKKKGQDSVARTEMVARLKMKNKEEKRWEGLE